jgi:hypothetical protein
MRGVERVRPVRSAADRTRNRTDPIGVALWELSKVGEAHLALFRGIERMARSASTHYIWHRATLGAFFFHLFSVHFYNLFLLCVIISRTKGRRVVTG